MICNICIDKFDVRINTIMYICSLHSCLTHIKFSVNVSCVVVLVVVDLGYSEK